MKHPKFKGLTELQAEIKKLKRNLNSKEVDFKVAVKKLKTANPEHENIDSLRKKVEGKEIAYNKAQRQLKSKLGQKERKVAEREKQKSDDMAQKIRKRVINKSLNAELKVQENILSQLNNVSITFPHTQPKQDGKESDLFISHASEDKVDFVKALADELIKQGVSVWYDEYALRIGDSLRKSIDKGLSQSRFGLIVLSKNFFDKNWTQYELNGLVAKEMEGEKVILPIWHNITKDEILKLSPSLVDKVALNTAILSVQEIAEKVADAVNNA